MNPYIAEFIGTAIIILLGNGVVSNVLLHLTKGNNSGWIVITFGWAIAVFAGVIVSAPYSGAHLNPAVTIAMAIAGKFELASLPGYILAQFGGAMAGQLLVWQAYKPHFDATTDADSIRACFCNTPAISHPFRNFITEAIGTFTLVFVIFFIVAPTNSLGSLDALPVALLVLGIGLSLGGPTGYAINPARDLGPRIIHAILPVASKKSSDWSYAWIPVAGPVIGGSLAAFTHHWVTII